MSTDQVKVNAQKVLDALLGVSAMDGYRLLKRTGLSEDDLEAAVRQQLDSVVKVDGCLSAKAIGEAYFSILPSRIGRAQERLSSLRNS